MVMFLLFLTGTWQCCQNLLIWSTSNMESMFSARYNILPLTKKGKEMKTVWIYNNIYYIVRSYVGSVEKSICRCTTKLYESRPIGEKRNRIYMEWWGTITKGVRRSPGRNTCWNLFIWSCPHVGIYSFGHAKR